MKWKLVDWKFVEMNSTATLAREYNNYLGPNYFINFFMKNLWKKIGPKNEENWTKSVAKFSGAIFYCGFIHEHNDFIAWG